MHTLTRAASAARPALLGFERATTVGLLPLPPGTAVKAALGAALMAAPRAGRRG